MKIAKLLSAVALIFCFSLAAQKKSTASAKNQPAKSSTKPADHSADEKKVRDMIGFLQYMLNTVGSGASPMRDKDVVITESYSKIFRDAKVQIEDDLDEDRSVVTNKDVVAYLKDVNFFFKDAKFDFAIENIEKNLLPSGEVFYKVSTKRNLTATTNDQVKINNSIPRYIEINYNPKEDELKIVSIYTSGIDEKRALTNWWNELSYEWKTILRRKLGLTDSVRVADIKAISAIAELDLNSNAYITNIEPLSRLVSLKKLSLAGCGVSNIDAIRNLTELTELDLSSTKIKDLTAIRYSTKLEKLKLSNTNIYNITILNKLLALKILDLRKVSVNDYSSLTDLSLLQKLDLGGSNIPNTKALKPLAQLIDLNLSNTQIQNIDGLGELINVQQLNLDSTHIRDITPLGSLKNLKQLSMNFTPVADIKPLNGLPQLEKIYCDQSNIKQDAATAFQADNPKVLVVFDSNDLKLWWETIRPEWQSVFIKQLKISNTPSKEELAKVQLVDSVNISGLSKIYDLHPLKKLSKLKKIVASKTNIANLSPIQHLSEIEYLDISYTKVTDLTFIKDLKKLKIVKAENNTIDNLDRISFSGLQYFNADNSGISDLVAQEFLKHNTQTLIIYKSHKLKNWWTTLSFEWRDIFNNLNKQEIIPTEENLHRLIENEQVEIKDASITNLTGLKEFIRIEKLSVAGTMMTSITPLSRLTNLKSLKVSGSPIREIDSLFVLTELEELDISNTPIEDIYAVWKLKKLKNLNCSGTQIKHINILEKLENLEYLDCSNTNVNKINALDYIPLKVLKCYNTRLSARAIESFKGSHPNCEVQYYR